MVFVVVAAAALGACTTGPPQTTDPVAPASGPVAAVDPAPWFIARSGGQTTTFREGTDAFGLAARNLGTYESITFAEGKAMFNESLVGRGLGPLLNAESCLACHRGHGSGTVPGFDTVDVLGGTVVEPGLLVRLSLGRPDVRGAPTPEPVYGDQIQDRAVAGEGAAEARVEVRYRLVNGTFADGTTYTLREPTISLVDLRDGPLARGTLFSARVAPPVIGLGLLEAIPASVIVAGADPEDRNRDGISGRPNQVWDRGREQVALGRFGWKAGQPDVDQQTAAALHGDLGITSQLYPDDPSPPDRSPPELSITETYPLTFYTRALAVPAARNVSDPEVRSGAELFTSAGCASCHTTSFTTGPVATGAFATQVIRPYTDLLLHDMGPALDDGRPEFEANGSEWRTPPLWGLGRRKEVSGVLVLLHDGRARTVSEAILWHGGEAGAARERFRTMSDVERNRLVRFLEAL